MRSGSVWIDIRSDLDYTIGVDSLAAWVYSLRSMLVHGSRALLLDLLALCICFQLRPVLGWAQITTPPVGSDSIIATVNGEVILASQLESEIRPQLAQLEEQARKLRQAVAGKMIDNLLIAQAAAREGTTVEAYLRRHVEEVTVDEREVDLALRSRRELGPAVLPAEARYRTRRNLEDAKRGEALRRLLAELRRRAEIRNYLLDAAASINLLEGEFASHGSEKPTVTIVVFWDYQCPFCRDAHRELASVVKRWPAEVRLVFRHFPLPRHPRAMEVAKAAVCASRQNLFWSYHERLMVPGVDLSPEGLVQLARDLKADLPTFERCLLAVETEEKVKADMELARAVHVDGTPTIFLNNLRIVSIQSLASEIEKMTGPRAAKERQ